MSTDCLAAVAPATEAPSVSVLVLAYWNGATLGDVLRALGSQTRQPDQLIVVESASDDALGLVSELYPTAEIVHMTERRYPGSARNLGLGRVRGNIVLSLDGDCIPEADWIERAVAALGEGHPAVGGAILNALDSDLVGWAWYLGEFTLWLPNPARDMLDMPTCNAGYLVAVFQDRRFTELPLLSADSLFHWTLRKRDGVGLRFVPGMRVRHSLAGMTPASYLRRRLEHGMSLGCARRHFGQAGLGARLFWVLGGLFLLPFFYALRLVAHALFHPDIPNHRFVSAFPLTVAGLTAWSWGQALGALVPLRR